MDDLPGIQPRIFPWTTLPQRQTPVEEQSMVCLSCLPTSLCFLCVGLCIRHTGLSLGCLKSVLRSKLDCAPH